MFKNRDYTRQLLEEADYIIQFLKQKKIPAPHLKENGLMISNNFDNTPGLDDFHSKSFLEEPVKVDRDQL